MKYRTLGKTGMKVSIVGYGASPLGAVFAEVDEQECMRAVAYAIDKGINYFDVAPFYGDKLAEGRLGKALEGKRDKIYLATKCCRYGDDVFDFSAKRVLTSIDESLKRLRTDYVDLFQVHDCEFGDVKQIIEETIPACRKVQQAGKARFVGITGLPIKLLRDIADKVEVDTILSYCHYNLMITDMDDILTPFARKKGIGLINASPLHMRILTDKGAPDWHPAPAEIKTAAAKAAEICRKAGVDIADLAMRFCLDYPHVATTLVGMSKVRHVDSNIKALTFKIDPALMAEVKKVVAPVFNRIWPSGRPENNY
jgi:L-galactose dehydrogenase